MSDAVFPVDSKSHTSRVAIMLFLLVAILATAFAAYFAFVRAPKVRAVFLDFDVALPAATEFTLSMPWLPLVVATVGLMIAGMAVATGSRGYRIASYVMVVLAVVVCTLAEAAIRFPLRELVQSLAE